MIAGKRSNYACLPIEAHQRHSVARPQFPQGGVAGIREILNRGTHAAAHVDKQDEIELLLFGRERNNGLFYAVIVDPKVGFRQTAHCASFLAHNPRVDVYK